MGNARSDVRNTQMLKPNILDEWKTSWWLRKVRNDEVFSLMIIGILIEPQFPLLGDPMMYIF